MDELLRLLEQYESGLADLTDDQLEELLANLRTESASLLEDEPTDAGNELLGRVAAAVAGIETTLEEREQAAEGRRADQAARRAQILGETAEGEEGDEPADDAAGEPAEGDEPAAPVEDVETPVPVAAGARPAGGARTAARRPRGMDPRERQNRPAAAEPQLSLVAAANLPNMQAGTPIDSPRRLAEAFMSAYRAAEGYRGPRVKIPVARIGSESSAREMYGDDRTLSSDARRNGQIIDNVLTADALTYEAVTAAGGICAPAEINYSVDTVGTDARPVRDRMLTRFGADRGGVETFPPPTLADVDGSVTVWTESNDRNPSSPTTKPCLTLTCPDPATTLVEAIVKCFEIGNFRARYWQEQVEGWTNLGSVLHARTAETELLTTIGGDSTQVSSGQVLDASIDVLTTLDRAVAAIENRHRLDENGPALIWGAPVWILDLMRSGIARQMNGTGTYDEKMAIADAQIERWLAVRHIVPTFFLDGEAGQIFGAQGDGPLLGWPSSVVTYLYPAGSWLFLDGGELDLGIVRDSVTNSTNNYQMFYESFEAAHFHGIESYRLSMDLCPDGTTSGTSDIAVCTQGS